MTDAEFHKQRMEEYREHQKYSSTHPLEELNDIINDDQVLLDPLDGMTYSFIANSEDDIWKFVCRFTNQQVFIGYLIEELQEDDPGFDLLNEDAYNMMPERKYATVNFNFYKDEPIEKVFYPDLVTEQYARENFKLVHALRHIEYPCAIQWVGEDGFDFGGDITKRLCSIIPLTNRDKYFIQV